MPNAIKRMVIHNNHSGNLLGMFRLPSWPASISA